MTECRTSGTVFYVNFVKRKTAFVGGFAGCGEHTRSAPSISEQKHVKTISALIWGKETWWSCSVLHNHEMPNKLYLWELLSGLKRLKSKPQPDIFLFSGDLPLMCKRLKCLHVYQISRIFACFRTTWLFCASQWFLPIRCETYYCHTRCPDSSSNCEVVIKWSNKLSNKTGC